MRNDTHDIKRFDQWQSEYDHREPKTLYEADQERLLQLRDLLDIDYEIHYTLEELEEILEETQ